MKSTKPGWTTAATLGLIAVAAATLLHFRSDQHLGSPGLRLTDLRLQDEQGTFVTTNSIFLPERVLDYGSELQAVQQVELKVLPPDTTFGRRLYQAASDGYQVQVSAVMMGTDRTSIHNPEFCLPSQGFQILARSDRRIVIEKPHRYELPVMRLDAAREVPDGKGGRVRQGAVYVYWFVSGSRLSNDHAQRMWWLALDLVRQGELGRWAYIGVLGACVPGQEDLAYARLESLIRQTVPEFQLTTPSAPPLAMAVWPADH